MGSITVLAEGVERTTEPLSKMTKRTRNIFTYRCHDFLVPILTHDRIVVLGYDASNQETKVYPYRSPIDERSLERCRWVSERYWDLKGILLKGLIEQFLGDIFSRIRG